MIYFSKVVLKNNIFEFDEKTFKQKRETLLERSLYFL